MESGGEGAVSVMYEMKKKCISFFTSLNEGLQYMKAVVVGQVKKAKARDEKEATEANLQTAKMQVEAADAAEHRKNEVGIY